MTAKTIIAKLQGINALVAGVRSAPTEMPGALTSEMLPCALTYPGEAGHSVPFYAGRRTERGYIVRFYVKPIGQGEGVDEGFQECLPFLDRFAETYHTPANIGRCTGAGRGRCIGGWSLRWRLRRRRVSRDA
jgi:hypothetical protein